MPSQDCTCMVCTTSNHGPSTRRHRLTLVLFVVALAWLLGPSTAIVAAQSDDPLQAVGIPTLSGQIPVQNGSINTATGNLHLEFPLLSLPQRGGPPLKVSLSYDSNIWYQNATLGWGVNQGTIPRSGGPYFTDLAGWRVSSSVDATLWSDSFYRPYGWCAPDSIEHYGKFSQFRWTSPEGVTHYFSITTTEGYATSCGDYTHLNQPTGDALAIDGSGYHMYVAGFNSMMVYAPDGTVVCCAGLTDTNGNYFVTTNLDFQASYPFHDTLGRTPVLINTTGNTTTYTVPNSGITPGTSTFTITTQTINYYTNFGAQYNGNISGTFNVIQSIQLPDGTSYSFGYDSGTTPGYYGQLTSMALPTGGTIHHTYANFLDSEYLAGGTHITRMIWAMSTPDGLWYFTPAVITQCNINIQYNCQQQFTVTKPAYNGRNDTVLYKSTINGGGWPIEADYYTGAVSPANLLASITQSFDFSHPCTYTFSPYYLCSTGYAISITKLASTITFPTPSGASLHQTTQFCYDENYGNLLYKWEWNYYTTAIVHDPSPPLSCSLYAGSTPDRTTTITYLNGSNYISSVSPIRNILNRPVSITVTNSGGGTVAQTVDCYDYAGGCGGSSFASATSKVNHDDTNFPASFMYRGDLTQIKSLISGTSNYLTTSMTYDMTGQVVTSTDAYGNQTSYDYTDNFYDDAGDASNPATHSVSQGTNAYLKTITHPTVNSVTLTETFGYYWGTAQRALSTDPNSQTTYFHFYDSLNRPTSTKLPNLYNSACCGWAYSVYPSASETQLDTGVGITSTTRSITCTGTSGDCRDDQTLTDNLGRTTSKILVSDPDGQTTVNTAYDSDGRVYSVSNRHRSGSSPTDGTEYYAYDGLNRKIQVTRPDGSIAYTYYGAAIGSNGRSSQLCSGYGVGYPVLYKDEAAELRQTWTDGFGRLIEVDEPDPSTGSLTSGSYAGTCYSYDLNNNLTSVAQGTQTRSFSYDLLSRLTSGTNPESGTVNYFYTTSGGALCSGDPAAVCRRTDARSITTTYAYDALNRLISKSYSDSTPQVKYGYDAVAPSGCTPPTLTITNGLGRRTSMCDGPGQSARSYNEVGNALIEKRTTNGVTDTFTYTYNLDGSAATVQYPSGRTVTYKPGGAQRPLSAKDVTNSIDYAKGVSSPYYLTYVPHGALQSLQNGSSLVSASFYNNRLQPCRISVKNTGNSPTSCTDSTNTGNVIDFTYNFNAGTTDNGDVSKATNNITSGRSVNYTYDSLNRIASAYTDATSGTGCWGETYTIDRYGNLTTIAAKSGYTGCTQESGLSITVNSANQINGPGTYTYDAAGNLTATPSPSSLSMAYDAEGHMTSAGGVTYYYDGDGKRVRKSSGTLYWYGISSDPLLETDGGGTLTNEYIFLGGERIARRDSSSNVEYYIADHLGSARVVTNASGTISENCDYYPYGGSSCSPSSINNYLFTGKERDSESGLDNFGARYNSSQYGRFMTPDPSNLSVDFFLPQTWNRYSYALNNPLQMVDRNGLWPTSIHNEIINEAFPGLSTDQLKTLYQSSYNVDHNPVNGVDAQDPSRAFMHGMSNGISLQDPKKAEQKGNDFIAQNEHEAKRLQAEWIASGHAGISPAALAAFGNALHTITDRTSPEHNKPWFGMDDPVGALVHAFLERKINSTQMNSAVNAARGAYLDAFGFVDLMFATRTQEQVTSRIISCGVNPSYPACPRP